MPVPAPIPPVLPVPDDAGKARKIRAFGWLLVVLGLALSSGIGVIAAHLRDVIIHNNQPGAHSHWNGTPDFTRLTFELFGSVFVFGLLGLLAGIFQILTGRRSLLLIVLLLLSVVAIVYLGLQIIPAPAATP